MPNRARCGVRKNGLRATSALKCGHTVLGQCGEHLRNPWPDDRSGPFPAAAYNVDVLVAMPGQQYSGEEISQFLSEAGFAGIEVTPTFGYWSAVTGVKP